MTRLLILIPTYLSITEGDSGSGSSSVKKLRGYQSRPTDNSQRKNIPQKASNVWIKAKNENNTEPKKVEKVEKGDKHGRNDRNEKAEKGDENVKDEGWRRDVKEHTYKVTMPYEMFVTNELFPYLVVNIGSGVSILKVKSPGVFERVSGSSLGGGTYVTMSILFLVIFTCYFCMMALSSQFYFHSN